MVSFSEARLIYQSVFTSTIVVWSACLNVTVVVAEKTVSPFPLVTVWFHVLKHSVLTLSLILGSSKSEVEEQVTQAPPVAVLPGLLSSIRAWLWPASIGPRHRFVAAIAWFCVAGQALSRIIPYSTRTDFATAVRLHVTAVRVPPGNLNSPHTGLPPASSTAGYKCRKRISGTAGELPRNKRAGGQNFHRLGRQQRKVALGQAPTVCWCLWRQCWT